MGLRCPACNKVCMVLPLEHVYILRDGNRIDGVYSTEKDARINLMVNYANDLDGISLTKWKLDSEEFEELNLASCVVCNGKLSPPDYDYCAHCEEMDA